MKFEAQCPACGIIVKRDATSGRYSAHSWVNGCAYMVGPLPLIDLSAPDASRQASERLLQTPGFRSTELPARIAT